MTSRTVSGLLTTLRHPFVNSWGRTLRLYSFLAQVIDFHDCDLERLYAYGRLLLAKLKSPTEGGTLDLGEDMRLHYYVPVRRIT